MGWICEMSELEAEILREIAYKVHGHIGPTGAMLISGSSFKIGNGKLIKGCNVKPIELANPNYLSKLIEQVNICFKAGATHQGCRGCPLMEENT